MLYSHGLPDGSRMNKLMAMECFVHAVETGSFSATARALGIGQPNVSRHIASLERSVGTQLLHRSSRGLVMTHEGQLYYAQARQALDLIERAESDARGEHNPQGLLRVACSETLGTEVLVGALPEFMKRYPDIEVDLHLGDAYVDLLADGLDLAIRGGILADSSLRARHIGSSKRIYVASREYLARHGIPQTPEDLLQHQCILYSSMARPSVWPFKETEVRVTGRLRVNNLGGARRAALAGLGIAHLPSWMVSKELASGAMQGVLDAHTADVTPIHAVYITQRLLPRRTIVFIDYIATVFDAIPGLDKRQGRAE